MRIFQVLEFGTPYHKDLTVVAFLPLSTHEMEQVIDIPLILYSIHQAANAWTTQEARAPAMMISIWFFRNILVWAPDW